MSIADSDFLEHGSIGVKKAKEFARICLEEYKKLVFLEDISGRQMIDAFTIDKIIENIFKELTHDIQGESTVNEGMGDSGVDDKSN